MAHTKRADLGGGSPRLASRLHSEQSVLPRRNVAATGFLASTPRHRAPAGAPDGKWRPCSRREPCPICSRPNGKCRIKGDFVHCWRGDSYVPPDILIGTTIIVAGQHWKKIADHCGFARNSACFVSVSVRTPYTGNVGKVPRRTAGQERQHVELILRFLRQADEAFAVPEFVFSNPTELSDAFQLIDRVHELGLELLPVFKKMAAISTSAKELMPVVNKAMKQIEYQQGDADFFRRVMLGDPKLNGWIVT